MNKELKIAVDFDGTLGRTMDSICNLVNLQAGTNLSFKDVNSWSFFEENGLENHFWASYDFLDKVGRLTIKPYDSDTTKYLTAIARVLDCKLDIVTANEISAQSHIRQWLCYHCPMDVVDKINIVCLGRKPASTKFDLNYSIFIDDSPILAEKFVNYQGYKRLYQLNCPWNKNINNSENITRVESWKELYENLAKIIPSRYLENYIPEDKFISGIYEILCKINGKVYIGSSNNTRSRLLNHKRDLLKGKHINSHLQNSFSKYGVDNFIFRFIEETPNTKEYLQSQEQYWMTKTLSYNNIFGFNICKKAYSNVGRTFSDESKRKLSLSQRKLSEPEVISILDLIKNSNLSFIQIGEKFNVTSGAICDINKGHSYQELTNIQPGSTYSSRKSNNWPNGHPTAKLNAEKVRQIKILLKEGKMLKEIAPLFDVGIKCIGEIKRGARWTHVNI